MRSYTSLRAWGSLHIVLNYSDGDCCCDDCDNAAIHYDAWNNGYCILHWVGDDD